MYKYNPGGYNAYEDPGADYFERRQDPTQQAKRLCQRIEALGFSVTMTPKAA